MLVGYKPPRVYIHVNNISILEKFGIETRIDLPAVGEHLQDQPNVSLQYSSKINITGTAPYATFATAQDIFGNQTAAVAAATEASLSDWAKKISDANNGINTSQVESIFRIQHDLIFKANITIAETLTSGGDNVLVSAFWLLLPFSRGSVHLSSAQEINNPLIDPKYFLIDFDLDLQTKIGRLSQNLWYTGPIDTVVVTNLVPGDTDLPRNATDTQWATFIADFRRFFALFLQIYNTS